MNFQTPISTILPIGKAIASRLKNLELKTAGDLLWHFPFRYDDYSHLKKIGELQGGETVTIKGRIELITNKRSAVKRTNITEAMVADETGTVKAVWFNQPFLTKTLRSGDEIYLSGRVDFDYYGQQFVSPEYEKITQRENISTARLVPVYSSTSNVTQKQLRFLIKQILKLADEVENWLPQEIVEKLNLLDLSTALKQIHFPDSQEKLLQAQRRLKFEEHFLLQLQNQSIKLELQQNQALPIKFQEEQTKQFVSSLPFQLTNDQRKVAWEILQDLQKDSPMNRLLEGDVGSGKTVVATMAMLNTALNNCQSILMAPTEILAKQHFESIGKMLSGFGVEVGLLTRVNALSSSSLNPPTPLVRGALLNTDQLYKTELIGGLVDNLTNTNNSHQKEFRTSPPDKGGWGVLPVNEQTQEKSETIKNEKEIFLDNKNSQAINEDLQVSKTKAIDPFPPPVATGGAGGVLSTNKEKPTKKDIINKIKSGELKIVIGTHALIQEKIKFKNLALAIIDEQHRFGVNQRHAINDKDGLKNNMPHFLSMSATPIPRSLALAFAGDLDISVIKEMPKNRKQIITKVVDPMYRQKAYQFIAEQITQGRQAFVVCPLIDPSDKLGAKSVQEEYEKLDKKIFPSLQIGLLHGKLKKEEKEQVMKDFIDNKIKILVSTSVIEVGVDIPNATVMMIESAERFGLAQLHQFRGRVGRSQHQSYCLLFTDNENYKTKERLEALTYLNNGFDLAEKDLQLRGPGEIYGTRQSGLPEFKIAKLDDGNIIQEARDCAQNIIKEIANYPLLQNKLAEYVRGVHLE